MHPAVDLDPDLDQFVEAFEAARQAGTAAAVDEFLPPTGHPLYLPVLRELVCVDLDYGWGRGAPTPLDEYRRRFPALFADPTATRAVVWEDYRQRRQAGEEPDPEDYRHRYGVGPQLPNGAGPAAPRPAVNGGDGPPTQVVPDAGPVAPPMVGSDGDWLDALGGKPGAADVYHATYRSDPAAAERYARVMASLPRVGDSVAGFRLEAELGRGAFGRVFLARDRDLADRPVALKVSAELFGEAQTMALLQHTNIVPIYSRHQIGPLQAMCMPYVGRTTLADVFRALGGKALPASGKHFVSTLHGRKQPTTPDLASRGTHEVGRRQPSGSSLDETDNREADAPHSPGSATTEALAGLERFTYPEAVLWLGMKLADGLAHAHERGVFHRDLKPANILLTDDGQPMLIDFNLADNTAVRNTEAGARVGGTLPYMAPEQIRLLQKIGDCRPDARTDIYSLGLILFELLTGRMAYPAPPERGSAGLAKMLTDRSSPPPRLTAHNPAVTPAVEAIIFKCLLPDPDRRYQSARALHEDIDRHLRHEPLKHQQEPSVLERLGKWRRRHPRLMSATSVGALAAVLLAAVTVGAFSLFREVQRRDAADAKRTFVAATDAVLPRLIRSLDAEGRTAAVDTAGQAVAVYGVFDRPDWQVGPLVRHLPPADQEQLRRRVGEVLFLMARAAGEQPDGAAAAARFADLSAACFDPADRGPDLRTATGHYLRGLQLYDEGRYAEAVPVLVRATEDDPRQFWAWYLRGNCHFFRGQDADAVRCYSVCITLNPDQARPYFNRGRTLARLRNFGQAVADFDRAAALDPGWIDASIETALSRYRQALALVRRPNLAASRDELLALAGAGLPLDQKTLLVQAEDRLTAILRDPGAPTRCYFHRADVRLALGNKPGAEPDVKEGFARQPAADDYLSWITRGLKRQAREPEKALADFRRAEAINPRSFSALQNQSHVLMEANRHEENLAVLNRLVQMYPELVEARAGRAVQLARIGRTKEALEDAEWVKAHSVDPFKTYQIAGAYALTGDPREALRLLATALTRGVGYTELFHDPDLDPLRNRPEFQKLAQAVRTLQALLTAPEVPPAQAPKSGS